MKKITLIFALIFSIFLNAENYNLTIVSIFQNESKYLKEWIDYHLSVGVDHFILYNNNSNDDFQEVLGPYIEKKVVEVVDWPSIAVEKTEDEWNHFVLDIVPKAFTDGIKRSKGKSKWVAIMDTDEFLISMKNKSIFKTLQEYFPKESGVCVNWQCYGTSHIWLKPGEGLLKNLTLKLPTNHRSNLYYKSIVKPDLVKRCPNPHFCYYLPGYYHVNTNHEAIGDKNNGVYTDILRINHYWARDEWYLHNVKVPRYAKWGVPAERTLKRAEEMNQVYDALF